MSDDEINEAIAEHLGARMFGLMSRGYWYRPNENGYTAVISEAWHLPLEEAEKHEYLHGDYDEKVVVLPLPTPDYCNDLNAMHEAEKMLDKYKLFDYLNHLGQTSKIGTTNCEWMRKLQVVRATARQRAEAFLRTVGKWKDDL